MPKNGVVPLLHRSLHMPMGAAEPCRKVLQFMMRSCSDGVMRQLCRIMETFDSQNPESGTARGCVSGDSAKNGGGGLSATALPSQCAAALALGSLASIGGGFSPPEGDAGFHRLARGFRRGSIERRCIGRL